VNTNRRPVAGALRAAASAALRGCVRPTRSVACLFRAGLVALAALAAAGPLAAEPLEATLAASQEEGYGRLVLTFADRTLLPEYDALASNGVLRIRFQDEVRVDVDTVPIDMPNFISIARRDPDGSAIRFALMADFRVNTMEAGEKLFIDLLPPGWSGMPPGLPDDVVRELAKRAEAALRRARALEQARLKGQEEPRVDLRIGSHPTFTRLAFVWNVNFDSAFVREGDMVKVTFNHETELDLGRLRAQLPPGVVDATAFSDEGKLKFLLRTAPDVDIRAFREDDAYVVDVTPRDMPTDPVNAQIDQALASGSGAPSGARDLVVAPAGPISAEAAAPQPGPKTEPETEPETGSGAKGERPQRPPVPAPPAKPADPEDAPQQDTSEQETPEQDTPTEPARAASQAPAPPSAADPEIAATPPAEAETPDPARDVADRADEGTRTPPAASVPPVIDLAAFASEAPETTSADLAALPDAVNPESTPAGYDDETRRFVAAEARRIGDIVRVVFPFSEPVASSVFRRHGSLWLVFDTGEPVDVRGMRSVLADDVEAVEVTTGDDWHAIRIDLEQEKLATIGVDGSSWVMTIGNTILEPSRPLLMERSVRSDGGTVITVPFRNPANVREIRDPFVGDIITTVTGLGPARGILKSQSFAEFDALMSAHGIAVRAKADDLEVRPEGDTVVIARPRGLAVSNGDLARGSRVLEPLADPSSPGQIDLGNLMTSDTEHFLRKIKEHEFAIANTPLEARRIPRMNLSRFYLAHGFAHEALGLMRLAAEDDPAITREPSFNLLMGAAQALAGRPREAESYLDRPELINNADAAVWRTITSAALRDWTGATRSMNRGEAVIGNYPVLVQTEFNLAAARTMVEVNDYGQAAAVLSEIDPSLATPKQAARYDIIRGQIADASGRSREALTAFDLVQRSDERPLAAEAAYRALRIRHRDGDVSTEDTIDALAGLAASWRGDETELKTLRFLAQLLVQNGEYRQAFEAMQSAVQANGGADTTRLLQDEMSAVFANLYLNGEADRMSPVKALALFYDFREMTPVGRRGDAMVRRLANRLIAMDLLDQAAELLRHQVDNRLKGAARARRSRPIWASST